MGHVPRLYLPGHIAPGPRLLDAAQSKRLAAVMRVRPGDPLLLFPGDGHEWHATVAAIGRDAVQVTVGGLARQEAPAARAVHLWCGLVRAGRFDWAVEKATEAGADVVRPLVSEFAARGEGESAAKRERWGRIAVEAAEQSGRLFVPLVDRSGRFEEWLRRPHSALVICDGSGEPWSHVAPLLPPAGTVSLAIGPEGGWSDRELAAARQEGALVLRLGANTLRTETAAVVAVSLLRGAAG